MREGEEGEDQKTWERKRRCEEREEQEEEHRSRSYEARTGALPYSSNFVIRQ